MYSSGSPLSEDQRARSCPLSRGPTAYRYWQRDYLGGVKPLTVQGYDKNIRVHIKPAIGALKLDALDAHTIQGFINSLSELSPKTVRNIHGVFHKALQQAVKVGYLRFNPADACELPRLEQKKIRPLDDRAMGEHFSPSTVYHEYKRLVASIGLPDARLHDLQHSYAMAALRAGDDVKTVQGNMGHHTAAFTLDVYGHVTEQMKQDSAARMEEFIHRVSGL